MNRFAPSSDPSLTIKYYERTPEQQAFLGYLVDSTQTEGRDEAPEGGEAVAAEQMRREPHGSVGAAAGHRAIAQSNSAEIAEALFRYTAPEEVCRVLCTRVLFYCLYDHSVSYYLLFLTGYDFSINLWCLYHQVRNSNVCHQYPFTILPVFVTYI